MALSSIGCAGEEKHDNCGGAGSDAFMADLTILAELDFRDTYWRIGHAAGIGIL